MSLLAKPKEWQPSPRAVWPLPLGTRLQLGRVWWTVCSVGWIGERYYWLVNKRGVVAMVPACELEEK